MISLAVNGFINITLACGSRAASLQSVAPFFLLILILCSCQPVCYQIEPQITYSPQARQLLSSPFSPLTKEELREEWAKELHIGIAFGHEMDLYRAITAFKRALILLPPKRTERRSQLEYCVFESYYLGRKFSDAIEVFENGSLLNVTKAFPAYKELRIMLYECYMQKGKEDKALQMLELLREDQPETAERLGLWNAFMEMDFDSVSTTSQPDRDELVDFIAAYELEAKSISKARTLNGLLPGLGYLYVGQKQTAATSLIINALFTGAACYFFKNGNVPMGIITASLESGWYLGGINGAGLAAQEYNQRLYEDHAKEVMIKHRLIPLLMLETTF